MCYLLLYPSFTPEFYTHVLEVSKSSIPNNDPFAPVFVHIPPSPPSFLHFNLLFFIPVFLGLWPQFLSIIGSQYSFQATLPVNNPFGSSTPCILTLRKKAPTPVPALKDPRWPPHLPSLNLPP